MGEKNTYPAPMEEKSFFDWKVYSVKLNTTKNVMKNASITVIASNKDTKIPISTDSDSVCK